MLYIIILVHAPYSHIIQTMMAMGQAGRLQFYGLSGMRCNLRTILVNAGSVPHETKK